MQKDQFPMSQSMHRNHDICHHNHHHVFFFSCQIWQGKSCSGGLRRGGYNFKWKLKEFHHRCHHFCRQKICQKPPLIITTLAITFKSTASHPDSNQVTWELLATCNVALASLVTLQIRTSDGLRKSQKHVHSNVTLIR